MTCSNLQNNRAPCPSFDWSVPVEGNQSRKAAFHRAARRQLKALTNLIGWPYSAYDLRSNLAGKAVSAEITLHHDHIYISVSQCRPGGDTGILIRTCKGRKDFAGGPNIYAPIGLLDDVLTLSARILPLLPYALSGGAA